MGWKIADNVDSIASPKGYNSFLPDTSGEAIDNTIVFGFQLGVLGLCLEEQFDSFDGCGHSFSCDTGHTSSEEIEETEVGGWGRLISTGVVFRHKI